MKTKVQCNQVLCSDCDGYFCNNKDYSDEKELTANSKSCQFFALRFNPEQRIAISDVEDFLQEYKEHALIFKFDALSNNLVFKKLHRKNEKVFAFIQVSEEDYDNFEFKLSVDDDILPIDKNQEDFSNQLLNQHIA